MARREGPQRPVCRQLKLLLRRLVWGLSGSERGTSTRRSTVKMHFQKRKLAGGRVSGMRRKVRVTVGLILAFLTLFL